MWKKLILAMAIGGLLLPSLLAAQETTTDKPAEMPPAAFDELTAMAPSARLALVLDQAMQAERQGDIQIALALYREAQGLTTSLGKEGDLAFMVIKYRELKLEAPGLEWRRVEHRFEDLRKVAGRNPLWTEVQLERALAEAEIRFMNQPEDDKKMATMRAIENEISLIMATLGDALDPLLLARARELGYQIEDAYGKRQSLLDKD